MKCMHIGARRGIPTISEVRAFLKMYAPAWGP